MCWLRLVHSLNIWLGPAVPSGAAGLSYCHSRLVRLYRMVVVGMHGSMATRIWWRGRAPRVDEWDKRVSGFGFLQRAIERWRSTGSVRWKSKPFSTSSSSSQTANTLKHPVIPHSRPQEGWHRHKTLRLDFRSSKASTNCPSTRSSRARYTPWTVSSLRKNAKRSSNGRS